MKLTKQTEAEVLQSYYDFWVSNLSANMETFSSYLVDDFSIFGSANGEVFFNKQDAVKFYTATADETRGKAELRNRNISVQPLDTNSVIVREESDLYVLIGNEWTFYGHARISCIVKHTDGRWKAVHQHASFPDHRTEEGQQLASEKIAKENLELREAVKRRTVELESKNRELEIEAALERVRARTMAMQHSDELIDAARVLFQQIEMLGAPSWNCSFNIWTEDKKYAVAWNATKEGFGRPFNTPSSEDVFLEFYTAAQEGKDFFAKEIGGRMLALHYEYLSTLPGVAQTLAELKLAGVKLPDFQVFNIAYFAQGYLMFITYEPVPELQDTFKRFANVFEQTYTRFLDLKKAEAQALRAEQDLIEIKSARKKAEDTLTELQLTQKQLIQSEKMASLGELTAGIAHEIQNPLNFVNNFSEVSTELVDEMNAELAKGDVEEAKVISNDLKQNLEKISHHGKRAGDIVKAMLQHSRSSSGVKELTDISALADEYLRLAYHGLRAKDKSFNATMKTDFDEGIGNINVISQDIGRVILNLITNAFYAVSEKQKSGVENYEPTIIVGTKKSGSKILISVKDNGNGIPEHIKEKIFQPFFTTKPTGQGTGLGLSLSYDIVKAHGGEMKVETNEGEGSEFIILIPVV